MPLLIDARVKSINNCALGLGSLLQTISGGNRTRSHIPVLIHTISETINVLRYHILLGLASGFSTLDQIKANVVQGDILCYILIVEFKTKERSLNRHSVFNNCNNHKMTKFNSKFASFPKSNIRTVGP